MDHLTFDDAVTAAINYYNLSRSMVTRYPDGRVDLPGLQMGPAGVSGDQDGWAYCQAANLNPDTMGWGGEESGEILTLEDIRQLVAWAANQMAE